MTTKSNSVLIRASRFKLLYLSLIMLISISSCEQKPAEEFIETNNDESVVTIFSGPITIGQLNAARGLFRAHYTFNINPNLDTFDVIVNLDKRRVDLLTKYPAQKK
jgi:hypothetical protein